MMLNGTSRFTHLGLVPGFHFTAVLLSDAIVLTSDFLQDPAQVLLGLGVHLHINRAAGNMVAQGCKLLQVGEQSRSVGSKIKPT